MTQRWLRGRLEGHYVGHASQEALTSAYGKARRYRLRIFRAFIRDITVFDPPPEPEETDASKPGPQSELNAETPNSEQAGAAAKEDTDSATLGLLPVELPENCFYQSRIDDARFFGVRPRTRMHGPIYDVAVDDFRITHSTLHQGRSYGRVEGVIYGRFHLPPEPELVEPDPVAMIEETHPASQPAESDASGQPRESARNESERAAEPSKPNGGSQADALKDDDRKGGADDDTTEHGSDADGLEQPIVQPEPEDEPPLVRVPFVLLTIAVAIALGIMGGTLPAMLWLGLWVPVGMIRMVIGGQFRVTNLQRAFGAILVAIQLTCLAMLFLHWWSAGCKSEDVWPLVGIFATVVAAALIPWPVALFSTQVGLAAALLVLYSPAGTRCPKPVDAHPTHVSDPDPGLSAAHPVSPRTNDDGSWPRRKSAQE